MLFQDCYIVFDDFFIVNIQLKDKVVGIVRQVCVVYIFVLLVVVVWLSLEYDVVLVVEDDQFVIWIFIWV